MICETWTTHSQVFVSFLLLLVTLLEADSKVDDRLDNRLYFSSVEPEEEEYRADPVEPTYDWDYASDYFLNSISPDHARPSNQTLSGGVQSPDGLQSPGGMHSPDGGSAPNSEIGESKLPTAIIIGVKKGGTRALLEFLRVHPDVRAPGPEIHFFDRNYDKGLEWYRKHMPHTNEHQITIEKTPSYFVTKSVPARVYNMSREVRLILVVRDPVTRAISDYTQAKTKRPDLLSFSQMAFLDNTTHGPVATSWGAVKIGIYAKHLERWLRYFPLRQFHFVHGERLISDPAGELALLQDFLGLKRVITEKYFYFDSAKGFPCLKVKDTEVAAMASVKSNASAPHCLGKTKGRTHPSIDEKVLQRLRNFYRPFNQKFYQLTGINFGWP